MSNQEDARWPRCAAVLCAAGNSRRMGGLRPKQFDLLDGERTPTGIALRALLALPVQTVIIAHPPGGQEDLDEAIAGIVTPAKVVRVPGGETRQQSILNALESTPRDTETVFIHDAARPFANPELYRALMRVLLDDRGLAGVIPALAVVDTIKRRGGDNVKETVDRGDLVAVQTPQLFPYGMILELHRRAAAEGLDTTDDSQLVEHYLPGERVALVEGSQWNFKLTRPADRVIAKALLKGQQVAHWTRTQG